METTLPNQPVEFQNDLPYSTAVLVLGIVSIATCFCWGIPGLVCGIIALVLASKAEILYQSNPASYRKGSYSNMKAGKICAIVGICLSGLMFLSILVKLAFGAAILGFFGSILPFLDK